MNKKSKIKRKNLMSYRLRPSVYNLFSPADFSTISAPISPNSLIFKDKGIEQEYSRRLFQDPTSSKPSEGFKGDLICFYSYLTLIYLILISFAIIFNKENIITTNHMKFHIIYLTLSQFFSYALLVFFYHQPNILSNSKFYMFCMGLVYYTYFIIGKEAFLSKIFNDNSGSHDLPVTLGIISFTIMLKITVFDSFLYSLYTVIYSLVLFLIINLSTHDSYAQTLSEFSVLGLTLFFQLIESQALDLRSRLIFWLQIKNEKNFKTTASLFTKQEDGINSESELLIKSCENVQKTLKEACSVIMYRDIKDSLKRSKLELESIKQRIGNNIFISDIKIEDSLMDADDKEFIHQNFVDIGFKSDKSSAGLHSIASFNEKNFYVFGHYGLGELEGMLTQLGLNWNFDIFFVKEITGRSLSVVGKFLFQKWELGKYLGADDGKIGNFFDRLEEGYLENPYHNACHAAEVLHSTLYFYTHSCIQDYLSQLELVGCIIANLGHDIGHPGLTNRFLVNNRNLIAIKYNDLSVLENLHSYKTFKILTDLNSNILDKLSPEDWVRCRRIIIVLILETDMSKHFEILGKFRTRVQTLSNLDIENFDDKLQILGMAIKCADIGHSSKELELHKKWTNLVCEEFFSQGDLEKSRGQPVSMYCDRETTDIPKSQAGFLKNICIPLLEVFTLFLHSEDIDKILVQVKSNSDFWSNFRKRRETVKLPRITSKELKRINSTK